jgi:hypothetical protein
VGRGPADGPDVPDLGVADQPRGVSDQRVVLFQDGAEMDVVVPGQGKSKSSDGPAIRGGGRSPA